MKHLTQQQEAEILQFYLIPNSLAETARHFKLSTTIIRKLLHNYNISQHDKQTNYKLRAVKTQESTFKKYGVTHTSQLKAVKDKIKATNLKKYGCVAPSQNKIIKEKIKKTNLKKYGVENVFIAPEIKKKIVSILETRYGTVQYMQSKDYINKKQQINTKRRQTCRNKYGSDYYVQSLEYQNTLIERLEKTKLTCKKKYNVEYIAQIHEIRLKKQNIWAQKSQEELQLIQNKVKQTCLRKYGVTSVSKVPEILEKQYNTKKQHKTFNVSKAEDVFYNILLKKFSKDDIFRQYSDQRYPYHCDFYIKSMDLFIELNYHWTHGGKPFKKSKADYQKLSLWQGKSIKSKFYRHAIDVWTRRDHKKMQTAIQHNLNYLVFYTEVEATTWLNNINK